MTLTIVPSSLMRPQPLFSLCGLTSKEASFLADKLMYEKWYLQDKWRDIDTIEKFIYRYFSWAEETPFSLPYRIGVFDGVLVFREIIPNETCGMMLKLWGKHLWGPTLARETRTLIEMIMDKFNLRDIDTASGDPGSPKMVRCLGFEIKEVKKDGFIWNGESYDEFNFIKRREQCRVQEIRQPTLQEHPLTFSNLDNSL